VWNNLLSAVYDTFGDRRFASAVASTNQIHIVIAGKQAPATLQIMLVERDAQFSQPLGEAFEG
jgi:hypothetical protein